MEVGDPSSTIGKDWGEDIPHPAASWFDATQQHFVALLARTNEILSNHRPLLTELVEYRILELKEETREVVPSHLFRFHLPTSLALATNNSLKVPALAKLSLDHKLLAIQFSDTLIRIVPLEEEKQSKHWTIELEASGEPIYGPADSVPHPRYKAHYDSMNCKDSTILGIVWSDHGGNSQDLVLVTTKAVLCYKISLVRNQMAATHTFPHARLAFRMWWEPISRTILVGSYGPASEVPSKTMLRPAMMMVQMRPFVLQFPNAEEQKSKKRLPRFELPPPRRLVPFAVGFGRNGNNAAIVCDLRLVNLYGQAYTIELCCEPSRICLFLYTSMDSSQGVDRIYYEIDGLKLSKTDTATKIVSIVDNVICITFRESRIVVFVDVGASEKSYIIRTWDEAMDMFAHSSVSALDQNLLWDGNGVGRVVRLTLNIEQLASSMQDSPAVVPFLLRRCHPRAHEIAISKFSTAVESGNSKTRRKYIDAVVQLYAQNREAQVDDWQSSMSLLRPCALLLPDRNNMPATTTKSPPFEQASVLCQADIIQSILLPMACSSIKNSDDKGWDIATDLAVGLVASLDHHQCLPCPALECLVVALLWNIGYAQELLVFLRSRQTAFKANSPMRDIPPGLVDIGTLALVSTTLGIVGQEGTAMDGQARPASNRSLKRAVHSAATRILAWRVSEPSVVIRYLLSHRRLSAAMALATPLFASEKDPFDKIGAAPSNDDLAICSEFLRASLLQVRQGGNGVGASCRLLFCLHSLVSRLDPEYFRKPQTPSGEGSWTYGLHAIKNRDASTNVETRIDAALFGESSGSITEDDVRPLSAVLEEELKPLFVNADLALSDQVLRMFAVGERSHAPTAQQT